MSEGQKELIHNYYYEYSIESWYHEVIRDFGASVTKCCNTDGLIDIKHEGKHIYGILETKSEQTCYNLFTQLESAFVQAICYSFQFKDIKFIIVGSQHFFEVFYLKDYPELIERIRTIYQGEVYQSPSVFGKKFYYLGKIAEFGVEYNKVIEKLNKISQECF